MKQSILRSNRTLNMRTMCPNKMDEEDKQLMKILRGCGLSSYQLGEVFDVSHSTILNWTSQTYHQNNLERNRRYAHRPHRRMPRFSKAGINLKLGRLEVFLGFTFRRT